MRRIYYAALCFILIIGCTDDPVQPPPTDDQCGNSDSLTPFDSLNQNYPFPKYRISLLKVSPNNGWWAGEYELFPTTANEKYLIGVFVYNPSTNTAIASYNGAWGHEWSPDGSKLLFIHNFTAYVLDINGMSVVQVTEPGETNLANWSKNGDNIIYRYSGTYSMHPDGSDKHIITSKIWNAKVLDSTRLFSVFDDSIYVYSSASDMLSKLYKPEMDRNHPVDLYDISPNGTYMLFQTREDGSVLNPWGNGIWLMDTETWTARKIRGAQWWNAQYYPTWASNCTFYASVFCRKDSSSMVWEFDLNGNPIRQITTKDMNVWME